MSEFLSTLIANNRVAIRRVRRTMKYFAKFFRRNSPLPLKSYLFATLDKELEV